ncbi:uncharacterized protein LOC134223883 [Armigeres subalbatus]|uniref:uncharacterized protein LOC134223883 n=1 Tax=Armigeres subalbatus TaxID=124917 RepID=UPI002ED5833F
MFSTIQKTMENAEDSAAVVNGNEILQQEQPVYAILQSELDRIVSQRDHAVTRLEQIIATVAVFQNDVALLETRRDMLKDCYQKYDQQQSALEQVMPEEVESRTQVEVKYLSGLSMFEKLIKDKSSEGNAPISRDSVRLPTVDLPIFGGSGENWLEWIDKYNSLIHRRNSLSIIQKFEYLKLSLRGAALGLIDSLPTTESNYAIAYDLLIQRYNNPKLLIQKHTRELFELNPVGVESAAALRNLFDSARKNLRCLQILEQPVDSWDAILIHLMSNKLDSTTRREWESSASGTKPPCYEQLEKFVINRCQVLDAMPPKARQTFEPPPAKRPRPELRALTVTRRNETHGCCVCGRDHPVASCHRFNAKSVEEKLKVIKRFALCFNCLKANHTAELCRNRGCLKCNRRHHTLIHRDKLARATSANHDRKGQTENKSE